jgi:hypothetical protein
MFAHDKSEHNNPAASLYVSYSFSWQHFFKKVPVEVLKIQRDDINLPVPINCSSFVFTFFSRCMRLVTLIPFLVCVFQVEEKKKSRPEVATGLQGFFFSAPIVVGS